MATYHALRPALDTAVTYLLVVLNFVLSRFLRLPVALERRDLGHFAVAAVGSLVAALIFTPTGITGAVVLAALPGALAVAYRQIKPNPAEVATKA